jgi:hypothetical protein
VYGIDAAVRQTERDADLTNITDAIADVQRMSVLIHPVRTALLTNCYIS